MEARPVRAPRAWAWPLLGAAMMGAVTTLDPARVHGRALALVIAVVAVAVLAVRRLWSLHPAPTMCAAMALGVFSGSWSQLGLGGLPLDRALLALVAAQFLLCAPGVAYAPRLRLHGVHLALALTVLYTAGSAAVAGTLTHEPGFLALMDQLGAVPFVAFVLAPAVFAGERERRMLLMTLAALGAYLGLTAVFETLGPHALLVPRYIAHADLALGEEARAGGPFRAAIAEGFSCYACGVACAIGYGRFTGRRARSGFALAGALSLLGCLLTLERGVWIGVLAGSLLAALARPETRRRVLPAACVAAALIYAVVWLAPGLAKHVSARAGDQSTVWDRQNQISAGLRMLAAHPLAGVGWERYTSVDLDYFRASPNRPMTGYSHAGYESLGQLLPLHETYVSLAVELGLLGLCLWGGTLLWAVGGPVMANGPPALDAFKAGLIAIFGCFLVIALFNPYQPAFPVLLLWVWAGVAGASALR